MNKFVMLYSLEDHKKYFVTINKDHIEKNKFYTTKDGKISYKDLFKAKEGDILKTHLGKDYVVFSPSLMDFILYKLKRLTQIIYPKDSAYIALKLNIKKGDKVLEFGTGSGALTSILAWAVGDTGKVITFEKEEKFLENAKKNLEILSLDKQVEFHLGTILEYNEDEKFDAIFIDVKDPLPFIDKASKLLKEGKYIGFLCPTTNQVCQILKKLKELPFADFEVTEILLRKYRINPDRFRPEDLMIGHTAYLLFARKYKEIK